MDQFTTRVRRLIPRWIRRDAFEERDKYSLTLPGLFLLDEKLRSKNILECIYCAIARRFEADHASEVFTVDDLVACGLEADGRLARNMATIALLVGSGVTSNDKTLRMPSDDEMITESVRKRQSFIDYLTHAANQQQSNRHFSVTRPWLTAPLCLEHDHCQAEYTPMGFLAVPLPQPVKPVRPTTLAENGNAAVSELDEPADVDLDASGAFESGSSWTTAAEHAVDAFKELLEAIATGKRDRDGPTTREDYRRLRKELLSY